MRHDDHPYYYSYKWFYYSAFSTLQDSKIEVGVVAPQEGLELPWPTTARMLFKQGLPCCYEFFKIGSNFQSFCDHPGILGARFNYWGFTFLFLGKFRACKAYRVLRLLNFGEMLPFLLLYLFNVCFSQTEPQSLREFYARFAETYELSPMLIWS